jgi:hypothetical protein
MLKVVDGQDDGQINGKGVDGGAGEMDDVDVERIEQGDFLMLIGLQEVLGSVGIFLDEGLPIGDLAALEDGPGEELEGAAWSGEWFKEAVIFRPGYEYDVSCPGSVSDEGLEECDHVGFDAADASGDDAIGIECEDHGCKSGDGA